MRNFIKRNSCYQAITFCCSLVLGHSAAHLLSSCAVTTSSSTRFHDPPPPPSPPFRICSYTSKNHPESITRYVYSKNKLKFGLCVFPTTSPTPSTRLEPSYIINRYASLISICSPWWIETAPLSSYTLPRYLNLKKYGGGALKKTNCGPLPLQTTKATA